MMSLRFPLKFSLVSLPLSAIVLVALAPNSATAQLTYPTLPKFDAPLALPPAVQKLQTTFAHALALQNKKRFREAANAYQDFLKQGAAQKIPAASEAPGYGNLAYCFAMLGDIKGQRSALLQFVKRVPTNPAAYAQLAGVEVNAHHWKPAQDYAEKALALKPPTDVKLTALFALGTASLQLRNPERATDSYAKAIAIAPKNAQLHFNQAVALSQLHRTDEAIKQAEAARDLAPKLVQPRLLLASMLQQQKRFLEALSAYDAALPLDEKNLLALFNRALILQQIGRNDEALSAFLAVTKLSPDNFPAQMNVAQLYLALQNWAASKYRYNVALKLSPNNPTALAGLGRAELEEASKLFDPNQRKAGFAEAERHLKSAIAAEPKNLQFGDQLSVLYERSERYGEAIAIYRARIATTPKEKSNYYRIATLDKEQRNADEFAKIWREYRVQNPDDVTSYRETAEVFELAGRKDEALTEMEAFLKRKPKDGASLLYSAHLLTDLGKMELAKARYRTATELDLTGADEPNPKLKPAAIAEQARYRLDGWRGLAQIAQKGEKWDEAIALWQTVKALDSEAAARNKTQPDISIVRGLAYAYVQNKQPDKAIEEYRALAQAVPKDTAALTEIALLEESQNRIPEAVAALRQIVERTKEDKEETDPKTSKPKTKIIHSLEAQLKIPALYLRAKQPESAITEYETLLKETPDNAQILSPLAQAYELTSKDDKALTTYDALLKSDSNAKFAEGKKAVVLVRLKRLPEARALYEKTLAKNPDDLQTFADIAHLYKVENNEPAFLDWLKTRLALTPASHAVMGYTVDEFTRQNREEAGWQTLKQNADLHKTDRPVLEAYAAVLQGHKKSAEALAVLQTIAAQNPKDLPAQVALTDALEGSGSGDNADALREKLLLDPTFPTNSLDVVRRKLAERYTAQKKTDRAIALYQELLAHSPADIGTANALAGLLGSVGRDREAVPVYVGLLKFTGFPDPVKANLRSKIGNLYAKIGNKTEAEAQFREALKLNPQDPTALAGLSQLK